MKFVVFFFFFSSRRRHTRWTGDWSSDVCSSDLAISPEALTAKSQMIRSWRLHMRTGASLDELAEAINPIVAGWINYYGLFGRGVLNQLLRRVNTYLTRWARRKYKRLRSYKRFHEWWTGLIDREPGLFAHWNRARSFDWRG